MVISVLFVRIIDELLDEYVIQVVEEKKRRLRNRLPQEFAKRSGRHFDEGGLTVVSVQTSLL